jgi:ParE toxin of type II toxin-antitoxin system, parDE
VPESIAAEVEDILEGLREDPYPPDSIPLRNYKRIRRIRFHWFAQTPEKWRALYRIIYSVSEQDRTVDVLRVRRRDKNTYLGL